jgi:hypothetical protein
MIMYPAPSLCQPSEREILLRFGETIYPEFLRRSADDSLAMCVAGAIHDDTQREEALDRFQVLLGVLRAWRPTAGERVEEMQARLGYGAAKNEAGDQWIFVTGIAAHAVVGGDVESFAARAARGIASTDHLRDALWLFGRAHRNAADLYMLIELAEIEFGNKKAVVPTLGVSQRALNKQKQSANNLAPRLGGRHANATGEAPWSLERQRDFSSDMLRRWIDRY